MGETRYIREYTNGVLTNKIPYIVSDEELQIEQVEAECKEANDQALNAYLNYDSLTKAQKEKVLKGLLGDFISRNRGNYIPSG